MDGYYSAVSPLGQQLDAGQTIGIVMDALGRKCEYIRASETGRILVLRTFPAVKRGDSLAVILDTSYAVQSP